ncbi:MAG TPA: CRTAC1 family protein [Gemmataceae bacterium]|nr:CRTAC1 family protein [Gemmataceae bacterium]
MQNENHNGSFILHSAFCILHFARWLSTVTLTGLLLCVAACQQKPDAPTTVVTANEEPPGPPLFEDITRESGVDFTYHNGEDTANHVAILESLGGGVALIDYDGDGLLDIFLTGGGLYAGADKKQIAGLPCKLYKNLGDNKFKDVTAEAGLDKLAGGKPWFYSHGAATADYDRDGWPDLLVTGWGRVALFHNIPVDPKDPAKGRRFSDVTAEAGLDQGITWATSAAFGDLDGDGYPDLYVCQYVNWSFANNPRCAEDGKTLDICPPKSFDGLPHKVYRNTGAGKFVDVSATAGLLPGGRDSSKGLGVLMVDLDADGKPDVYVANDTTNNLLYMNRSTPGKIRFQEVGLASGSALDDRGSANGSMGVDAADYDGRGKPSLWVTNYEHELHALYRNELRPGTLSFRFRTLADGLAGMGQKYVGWGTAFLDVDLNGWEDVFVAHGHVRRHHTSSGIGRKQPPLLFGNIGGKFTDMSRQIGSYQRTLHPARGVGFGDLDNNGRTDLVISHINEPVTILRGIGGPGRHWLGVQLVGKDHADVVGAKVELRVGTRTLTRCAKGGGSYLSSGDRRLLFGLGDATKTGRLTVTWPDGAQQHFDGLLPDRYHRLFQGPDGVRGAPPVQKK